MSKKTKKAIELLKGSDKSPICWADRLKPPSELYKAAKKLKKIVLQLEKEKGNGQTYKSQKSQTPFT